MRKLFVLLFVLSFCLSNYAQSVKVISLDFNKQDFIYDYNILNELNISSSKFSYSYGADLNAPALPFVPINVAVKSLYDFDSFTTDATLQTIFSKTVVAQTVMQSVTSQNIDNKQRQPSNYAKKTYPFCVRYIKTENFGEYKLLRFLVCPFTYNAKDNSLSLTKNIKINIKLKNVNSSVKLGHDNSKIVKSLCINPSDVVFYDAPLTRSKTLSKSCDKIEYLIITSDKFKDSFLPLADWKKKKGVPSAIVSIEQIKKNSKYSMYGNDIPLMVKHYLYDAYCNGLKFVLLGGGDDVVPTRKCYMKINVIKNSKETLINCRIPTDMYFQCFDDNFEWNANNNNIYGELDDNISLFPNIYLSRVACHSKVDVETFVKKVLNYEQNANVNNTFLYAGCSYGGNSSNYRCAEDLYNNCVKKWTSIEPKYFFDKKNNFNFPFGVEKLSDVFSQGYSFIDVLSHGDKLGWNFYGNLYRKKNVENIENKTSTIVLTEACLTNDFTVYENIPEMDFINCCLGEAFINAPKSGVVAYIGSSVEGLGNVDDDGYGVSYEYDKSIQEKMFGCVECENLAKIVSVAKYEKSSFAISHAYYRWIQFGLNTLGDPEMPVFTEKPICFNNINITCSGSTLNVKTNVEGCRVCVMSSQDNGKSYYSVENGKECVFHNVSGDVSIVVTKRNYIPYIKTAYFEPQPENVYVQNENINGNKSFYGETIHIGTNVTNSKQQGDVRINGGTYIFDAEKYVIKPNVYISRDAKVTVKRRM